MGTLGPYRYPDLGPHAAKEVVEEVLDRSPESLDKEAKEELASALGHKDASSGRFRQKLTALKRYGLLKGRGELEVTALAHELDEEGMEKYGELMDNVPLFEELDSVVGPGSPSSKELRESVENKLDVEDPDPSDLERVHEIFDELRKGAILTSDNEIGGEFDRKEHFFKYKEKLDNPNTRKLAIQAISKKVDDHYIRNPRPVFDLISLIEDDSYVDLWPEVATTIERATNRFVLHANSEEKNNLRLELRQQVDRFTDLDRVKRLRSESRQVVGPLVVALTEVADEGTPQFLWNLGLKSMETGVREDDRVLRQLSQADILQPLFEGKGMLHQFVDQGFKEKAEEEIWNRLETEENEALRSRYETILRRYLDVI